MNVTKEIIPSDSASNSLLIYILLCGLKLFCKLLFIHHVVKHGKNFQTVFSYFLFFYFQVQKQHGYNFEEKKLKNFYRLTERKKNSITCRVDVFYC